MTRWNLHLKFQTRELNDVWMICRSARHCKRRRRTSVKIRSRQNVGICVYVIAKQARWKSLYLISPFSSASAISRRDAPRETGNKCFSLASLPPFIPHPPASLRPLFIPSSDCSFFQVHHVALMTLSNQNFTDCHSLSIAERAMKYETRWYFYKSGQNYENLSQSNILSQKKKEFFSM